MKKNTFVSQPLLSVIVPVYNVEKYINKCIDSILGQTYKNIELILVDDGSTDLGGKICDDYKEIDSRIVVIHQENQGLSVARNSGLLCANGRFISFIDSDDWIKVDMFTIMINSLIENNLEVVECDIIPSTKIKQDNNIYPLITIENPNQFMQRIISKERFSVCRRIYKKDILGELLFIPNKIYEDLFFTIELLNNINKLGYIQFPFYIYFKGRSDSIMRSNYNLKKLNSIDAGSFLVKNTLNYGPLVKKYAINYLLKSLSRHYNHLFRSPEFDLDLKHRRQIRKTIKKYYKQGDFAPYTFVIKILPIWLYRWFFIINESRINFQSQFSIF